MARRNLTIQLDEDVIQRAKVAAAKRGTSVSAMVAHELERLLDADQRYEAAHTRAQRALTRVSSHRGRSWTRDDLHGR